MAGDESLDEKSESITTEVPNSFDVVVVNLDEVLYEDKADSLVAPGPFGNFAILPGHTPLFTKLDKGQLVINNKTKPVTIDMEGGIAKITQNKITVLVGF